VFFEGAEKKAQIIVNAQQLNLLTDFSEQFWLELVNQADASILSQLQNDDCKAFLLSESCLFIWRDRLLLMTCGQTRLVRGVEYFIEQVGRSAIAQLIYQRKNEYFATAQSSSFTQDCQLLDAKTPGLAYRFGELHGHHNYLFHSGNDYQADGQDKTYQLLAYNISSRASAHLTTPGLSAAKIREFLQLDTWFDGFTIDDHVFRPFGYSLNAIKGDKYLTIHVTPEADSSYVSFESNIDFIDKTPLILSILDPLCIDFVCFNEFDFETKVGALLMPGFVAKSLSRQQLSNGYEVYFARYIKPQQCYANAAAIELSD
jgi:S-adenosylmethionine decarboxylase